MRFRNPYTLEDEEHSGQSSYEAFLTLENTSVPTEHGLIELKRGMHLNSTFRARSDNVLSWIMSNEGVR